MVSVVPAITNWQIRSTSLTSLCVCVSVFGQAKLEFFFVGYSSSVWFVVLMRLWICSCVIPLWVSVGQTNEFGVRLQEKSLIITWSYSPRHRIAIISSLLTFKWSCVLPEWWGSAHRQLPRCHPRGRLPELSHQHVSFLSFGPPICVCSSVKRTRCQNKFTTDL